MGENGAPAVPQPAYLFVQGLALPTLSRLRESNVSALLRVAWACLRDGFQAAFKAAPAAPRHRSRWKLLSWISGSSALSPEPESKPILVVNANPKAKHSMLPILVVLFLISYSLMTMLIVEQGRTIENQRSLIRSLFRDSSELSRMKDEAFQKQRAAAQAQAEAKAHSQVQTPSTQDKEGRDHARADRNTGKLRKQGPPRFPKGGDASDDVRRVMLSI
jgi:hypothetical protein